mmetsp:Transcript_78103/g.203496  ORF Transcript_78103/g.203496 Transcript_78103/m.203496 type:complete len:233 (+) Transcript_78103:218-916(+)
MDKFCGWPRQMGGLAGHPGPLDGSCVVTRRAPRDVQAVTRIKAKIIRAVHADVVVHAPVQVDIHLGGIYSGFLGDLVAPLLGEGGWQTPGLELCPVELAGSEHAVLLEIAGAALPSAKTAWQLAQQGIDEPLGRVRKIEGERQLAGLLATPDGQQAPARLRDALVVEGRVPRQELEGEHAQGPPVHRVVMVVGKIYHLRSHVIRRACQRTGLAQHVACEAHVTELGVAALFE